MAGPISDRQLERYWLRLRREAHELYREAGTLRARVRELERELAASERALASERQAKEKLRTSHDELRARLRRIERSRGWRLVRMLRRIGRGSPPPDRTATASPPPMESPQSPAAPEPTSTQRWAAEAARRAAAWEQLTVWIAAARAAEASEVAMVAGSDPSEEHSRKLIGAALSRGEPVCELEAQDGTEELHGVVPPGIQPSLVPDILRTEFGKERVFICTVPAHASIRWIVPAQQEGWSTAAVLGSVSPSGALTYVATHADIVIVESNHDALLVEETTGVKPTVIEAPTLHDVIEAVRSAPKALPRLVLGID